MTSKPTRLAQHGKRAFPIYQGGSDFWALYRDSYNLLSAFTSTSDWQHSLEVFARTIAKHAHGRGDLQILDVGAGIGINSKAIQDRLAFDHGISSRWTLTEPNPTSRTTLLSVFSLKSEGYRLVNAVPDVPVGSKSSFDFILFLHSTYYTTDLLDRILRYRSENLNAGGGILILAMERTSPFFLDTAELIPPHTAGDIVDFLKRCDLNYEMKRLPMHMRIPASLAEKDCQLLYKLMANGHLTRSEFGAKIRRLFSKKADLQDRLIFIPAL